MVTQLLSRNANKQRHRADLITTKSKTVKTRYVLTQVKKREQFNEQLKEVFKPIPQPPEPKEASEEEESRDGFEVDNPQLESLGGRR